MFCVAGCLPAVAQADQALLENLIELTSSKHTFRSSSLPEHLKPATPEPARVAAKFDPIVDGHAKLTPEQKKFVKANYPKLADIVNTRIVTAASTHMTLGVWMTEYLREAYLRDLTPAEMKTWTAYFKTAEGEKALSAILAYPEQPTDAASVALMEKFAGSAIGSKFLKIFGEDMSKWMDAKIAAAGPKIQPAIVEIFTDASLTKIVDDFVTQNYKQP